jgi:hypothetical protein
VRFFPGRELGLERHAVDAGRLTTGYSRPLIRAEDYCALLEAYTYRGDCVLPAALRRS